MLVRWGDWGIFSKKKIEGFLNSREQDILPGGGFTVNLSEHQAVMAIWRRKVDKSTIFKNFNPVKKMLDDNGNVVLGLELKWCYYHNMDEKSFKKIPINLEAFSEDLKDGYFFEIKSTGDNAWIVSLRAGFEKK
jgi:hypothetical protein